MKLRERFEIQMSNTRLLIIILIGATIFQLFGLALGFISLTALIPAIIFHAFTTHITASFIYALSGVTEKV